MRNLAAKGYTVLPVNPREKEIAELRTLPLQDFPAITAAEGRDA